MAIYFKPSASKEVIIGPESDKIGEAIRIPSPSSKKELMSVLGFFNYLSPFIPNVSAELKQLHQLIKKDVSWQ